VNRPQPHRPTVEELAERLDRLEARLAELEARRAPSAARAVEVARPPEEAVGLPALPQGTLALAGGSLLIFAGAYLVRALTDGRVLPPAIGVAIGLAYAALWQLKADRDAGRGRRESAAFLAFASSLIAFPLIWETTARLGLLGARAAYTALVAFFVLGLGVAWRRRLAFCAWLTTLLALATAVALLLSSHDLLAALVSLVAIAAGLEWLALHDTWRGLRWAVALVLDGVAFLLVAVATRPRLPEDYVPLTTAAAAAAVLALPALHVAAVAARTLLRGRPVTVFEVVQGKIAALLGFGGAWWVLAVHGESTEVPSALALLVGLLCYAVAFAFVERRPGQGRNFYFYSTAAGLLTLGGTLGLDLGAALPLTWGALGLIAALLGRRFGRMTLRVHSALYLLAGAVETGLMVACIRSLAGQHTGPLSSAAWLAAGLTAFGWAVLATDPGAPRSGPARSPQLLLALLVVFAVGKAAQMGLWALFGDALSRDVGAAAVTRTAVLAVLVLALAWLSRRGELPELGWLVYPLVGLGGIKLLTQDLPHGRPATLVLSLALYGAVLILAPRLLKRRGTSAG
jgi:hypothetical protein